LQVEYCNKNGIDFLAYNTGHGSTATLAKFNGVQISLSKLDRVTIEPDGKSAWVQGGTRAGPVNAYLWDEGYVTTTGACDCVGLAGAGLGGGHGRLKGLYGMISDNMRQLNVVLADGAAVRVNATSHCDLYWALRGAGHNFGIVTSIEMNLYPRGPSTWHYKNYLWKGDKLNDVFTAINVLHGDGTTPINMTQNNGIFLYVPSIDIKEPVISWQFAFRGSAADAAQYFTPFDAIATVSTDSGDVPYPDLAHSQNVGLDDISCTGSAERLITTTGLRVFNITAEQQIFDSFKKRIAEQPSLATYTFIIHEGYSTQAVEDKNPANSAYPFRADRHVTQFQGNLASNATKQDQDQMWKWAREVQDLWNAGQPTRRPDSYVNYANGFETVQDWYGHEPWRVAKLRGLKAKYDPSNRFRFYNPVI
jgi:FAD/FMN-containing dehydrogenase